MDKIIIRDLRARCVIGVNEDERREKQDVVINVTIFTDLRKAGRSDRFEDTIDYRAVKKKVLAMVEQSSFRLIEALAEAAAEICLSFPAVQQVQVRVDKPGALRFARSAAVEILRGRAQG
jgi:FolB domain-containing protein